MKALSRYNALASRKPFPLPFGFIFNGIQILWNMIKATLLYDNVPFYTYRVRFALLFEMNEI